MIPVTAKGVPGLFGRRPSWTTGLRGEVAQRNDVFGLLRATREMRQGDQEDAKL